MKNIIRFFYYHMNTIYLIIKHLFRIVPYRFIGEISVLGLIILFLEFNIGEEKTLDWRLFYKDHRSETAIDSNIVVIKIDDLSFRSIHGGYVNRDFLADLVSELKSYNPKVIGLDFLLTTPYSDRIDLVLSELKKADTTYSDPDQRLANALKDDIPMVLAFDLISNDKNKIHVIEPIDCFLLDNIHTGYTKVKIEKDEICRHILLFKNLSAKDVPSFATQICRSAGKDAGKDFKPKRIHFKSPVKTFATFSSKDVLEGKFRQVSESWFQDKIILVGVTYSGSGDFFRTPLTGIMSNREELPGVFIHAMVVKNILDDDFIPAKNSYYMFIILVITLLIIAAGIILNNSLFSTLTIIVFGSIHILLCFRLFLNGINIPLLVPVIIMTLGIITGILIVKIRNEYRKNLTQS
ncbi:MAG: CHASE2 domain-containing protein [Bacteroidales bacterium]|nr:MAG: CHASE2 domain-containing protein [Bacteroidales bacterium]